MILIVIGMLAGSIVADEMLFRAIESENPELYKKLGYPDWFVLMWNPVVITKVFGLILLPSSFDSDSYLLRKLWISRLWNLGLIASIVLAVQMDRL